MAVKALCTGNNYSGSAALKWCHYDAERMENWLLTHAPDAEITSQRDRTAAEMEADLLAFVQSLTPGDHGIVSYSGHGSWVADYGGDEPDDRDEVWVGNDLAYFPDDRINRILARADAPIVVYSDSCHSGTVTRAMVDRSAFLGGELTRRYYPLEEPATAQFTGRIGVRGGTSPVLLMSGCTDLEYSYETSAQPNPGGVFTTTLLACYRPGMTHREHWKAVREVLPNASFPQSPRLFGSTRLRSRPVFPA